MTLPQRYRYIVIEGPIGAGVELAVARDAVAGLVNVPAECVRPLQKIRLHAARPAGSNFPTAAGVAGVNDMLALLANAGPDDVAICLLSGGGSALLPAPVNGISLEEKQTVTRLLHESGATINEMNAVRKHLSRIKGGGLTRGFHGRKLITLIISDVVGDPLDVIASGPTAADPTTFAEALEVLRSRQLLAQVGLEREYDTMPADLSGGMRKRAGLARALALEPAILLVDEPSAGLDPVTAAEIDALLVALRDRSQTTLLVVTHNIPSARAIGHELIFLDQGRIIAQGTPAALEASENPLVRQFMSSEGGG